MSSNVTLGKPAETSIEQDEAERLANIGRSTGTGAQPVDEGDGPEGRVSEVGRQAIQNQLDPKANYQLRVSERSWSVIFCESAVKAAAWLFMGAIGYATFPLVQKYRIAAGIISSVAVIYSFAAQKSLGSARKPVEEQ